MADGLIDDIDSLFGDAQAPHDEQTGGDISGDIDSLFKDDPSFAHEEAINEGDYSHLGWKEALAQGAGNGLTAPIKLAGSALSGIADYATHPGKFTEDSRNALVGAGQAVMNDPRGTLLGAGDITARAAGNVLSSIEGAKLLGAGGAALGTAIAPGPGTVVGGAIGGVAGAILGPTAFEGLLGAIESITGLDVQKKNSSQIVGEIGEGIGGAVFGYGAKKALNVADAGARGVGRYARNRAAQIAARENPENALRLTFAKHGVGFDKEGLEKASKIASPKIIERAVAMRQKDGQLPRVKEGTVFETVHKVINEKPAGGVSLLDDVGKDVHEALTRVGHDYSVEDIDGMLSSTRRNVYGTQAKEKLARMEGEIKRPFISRAAKEAGIPESVADAMPANRKRLNGLSSEIDVLTKKDRGYRVRIAAGKLPKNSPGRVLANENSASLDAKMNEWKKLSAEIKDFDDAIAAHRFEAPDFWELTKDGIDSAGGINWEADGLGKSQEFLRTLRGDVQDSFRRGMSEPDVAMFNKANEEYAALKQLSDIAKASIETEYGTIRQPKTNVGKLLRGTWNSLISTSEKSYPAIEHFKAMDRAWDGADYNPGRIGRFYRYLSEGGMPELESAAKSVGEFFSAKQGAIFSRTLLATEEYMDLHPEELQTQRGMIVETIPRFHEALSKIADAQQATAGAPMAAKRQVFKTLAQDQDVRPFLNLDESSGLTEGVDALGGEPLSVEDRDRYFLNLSRLRMNNFDKSKRRRYYNETGKFMPEPLDEEKSQKIDEPEVEKQIQMEKAREAIRPIKSSKDVAKAGRESYRDALNRDKEDENKLPQPSFIKPSIPIDWESFSEAIGIRESSGRYDSVNTLGFVGKYQFGLNALVDAGLVKKEYANKSNKTLQDPSVWKDGLDLKTFLTSPEAQEEAMARFTERNYKTLKRIGVLGSHSSAEEIAGALAVAHLKGPGGAKNLILHGKDNSDAYGTKASEYRRLGGRTQLS